MRTSKFTSTTPESLPTNMQPPRETLPTPTESTTYVDSAERQKIAEAAYYHAEQRGFAPGHELEDWLAAEAEIVGHSLERVSASSTRSWR